uniref:Uncharacterized protein n=1 Tax=Phaeomonas parva TaxID=124430 RepID=A0A6U4LED7_9STRA
MLLFVDVVVVVVNVLLDVDDAVPDAHEAPRARHDEQADARPVVGEGHLDGERHGDDEEVEHLERVSEEVAPIDCDEERVFEQEERQDANGDIHERVLHLWGCRASRGALLKRMWAGGNLYVRLPRCDCRSPRRPLPLRARRGM